MGSHQIDTQPARNWPATRVASNPLQPGVQATPQWRHVETEHGHPCREHPEAKHRQETEYTAHHQAEPHHTAYAGRQPFTNLQCTARHRLEQRVDARQPVSKPAPCWWRWRWRWHWWWWPQRRRPRRPRRRGLSGIAHPPPIACRHSRQAARRSTRKSGAAMLISASARAFRSRPNNRTAPNSVAT